MVVVSTTVIPWLYSPLDLRFVGSNPARVSGFFQSVKILSMTSFGREVKPWAPVVDLRHVKEPQAEIRASEQNLLDFSRCCFVLVFKHDCKTLISILTRVISKVMHRLAVSQIG